MTPASLLGFEHHIVPATGPWRLPLLLLHGTGGDENDLLGLGQALAPGAALVSPRGKVLEHGMPRFFGRIAEGVFDLDEVRRRTHDLADFVLETQRAYRLAPPIAVGFSNGANVAAAMMLLRPDVLAGAILLRPMAVLDDPARGATLKGKPVLMLSGARDPVMPPESAERLSAQLRERGAEVDHASLRTGHTLTQEDVVRGKAWLLTHDPQTPGPRLPGGGP